MNEFLSLSPDFLFVFAKKIWWFLIVLGVLVVFHELGHFLAARWVGVKVLKFSLGFGPKLLGRTAGDTEYVLSLIPLGGYVKLFGEEASETIAPQDQIRSFAHQSLSKRMLIVAAGPGFNFILSYIIFTIWLASGSPLFVPTMQDLMPVVEVIQSGSPAEKAGLEIGDRIIRVDEEPVSTQNELYDAVNRSHGHGITIDVDRHGQIKTLLLTPTVHSFPDKPNEKPMYLLGIEGYPPEVAGVLPNTPAQKAGLRVGDRIIDIEGTPIATWSEMTKIIRDHPGHPLSVTIQRNHQTQILTVTPEPEQVRDDGHPTTIGKIGIMRPSRSTRYVTTPFMAPLKGLQATWEWSALTIVGVYKMLTGDISSKNIGGPLMIATVSGENAERGLSNLIFLIAILSINLGILNLLPIPILDGGHLFFFTCEAILGRPLGDRPREIAQQIGLMLLVSIMVYATWNDIARLLQ